VEVGSWEFIKREISSIYAHYIIEVLICQASLSFCSFSVLLVFHTLLDSNTLKNNLFVFDYNIPRRTKNG
jgi:hypothetical protein